MKLVNIHEAKTQLSRLVQAAIEGEEVILASAGKPIARIVPIRKISGRRTPGMLKGRIRFGPLRNRSLWKRDTAFWETLRGD
jgi:prevent-host-death family protein